MTVVWEVGSIVLVGALCVIQTVPIQTIQFSISTVSWSKTAIFQKIQFSLSTQFKYQNSSISSNLA